MITAEMEAGCNAVEISLISVIRPFDHIHAFTVDFFHHRLNAHALLSDTGADPGRCVDQNFDCNFTAHACVASNGHNRLHRRYSSGISSSRSLRTRFGYCTGDAQLRTLVCHFHFVQVHADTLAGVVVLTRDLLLPWQRNGHTFDSSVTSLVRPLSHLRSAVSFSRSLNISNKLCFQFLQFLDDDLLGCLSGDVAVFDRRRQSRISSPSSTSGLMRWASSR